MTFEGALGFTLIEGQLSHCTSDSSPQHLLLQAMMTMKMMMMMMMMMTMKMRKIKLISFAVWVYHFNCVVDWLSTLLILFETNKQTQQLNHYIVRAPSSLRIHRLLKMDFDTTCHFYSITVYSQSLLWYDLQQLSMTDRKENE